MIVENKKQLEEFLKLYNSEDSILVPIPQDSNKHSVSDELSLLYVKLFNGNEYILPFNHSETLNIEIPNLESNTKKYTYDRKKLNHFIKLNDVIDINLLHYLATSTPLYIDDIDTNAHHFFNMRYYKSNNINNIIPVLKHLEKCREIASMLKDTIEKYEAYVNLSYNNEVLDNLSYIESNGLQTVDGMVHSEYNIYTSTGRPSNRFGGTNFAALNKTDGSRKPYVSRFKNGVLVEMDYDAYHLRLIADKVGYKFPEGSVHEHMAKFYGCDYEESKQKSFQYLYGHIPIEVVQMNPYFGKVYDYIEGLWKEFKSKHFIESDIYSREIRGNDFSANKLFNYYIQLLETESNALVIKDVRKLMEKYKSKFVLYSYDSFLFDVHIDDGLPFLTELKKVLERGKYPTKAAWGNNYDELPAITEKF